MYLKLNKINKIFKGETVNDLGFNFSLECIEKFKNAPITSTDVEKSFSFSKHMLPIEGKTFFYTILKNI